MELRKVYDELYGMIDDLEKKVSAPVDPGSYSETSLVTRTDIDPNTPVDIVCSEEWTNYDAISVATEFVYAETVYWIQQIIPVSTLTAARGLGAYVVLGTSQDATFYGKPQADNKTLKDVYGGPGVLRFIKGIKFN